MNKHKNKWSTSLQLVSIDTGEILNPEQLKDYTLIQTIKLNTIDNGNGTYTKQYRKLYKHAKITQLTLQLEPNNKGTTTSS